MLSGGARRLSARATRKAAPIYYRNRYLSGATDIHELENVQVVCNVATGPVVNRVKLRPRGCDFDSSRERIRPRPLARRYKRPRGDRSPGGAFLLLLYELLIRYGQKSQPKSYSSYKTRLLCRQVGVASLHFDH